MAVSLSIPESIVVRVHQRLENKEKNKSTIHNRRTSQNANATACKLSVIESDEKWAREALITAQKLRTRIQKRNK